MTKQEYPDQLRTALNHMDAQTANDLIKNIEEHLETGIEAGKTDEKICLELGDVTKLAKEQKEEYKKSSLLQILKKDRSYKNRFEARYSSLKKILYGFCIHQSQLLDKRTLDMAFIRIEINPAKSKYPLF